MSYQTFNAEKPTKQPGYEDGKLIHPEERITPSSVGASVAKDARAQMSYQEAKDAEEFVSTMFGKVGEEGPWTPVFRTMKAVSKFLQVKEPKSITPVVAIYKENGDFEKVYHILHQTPDSVFDPWYVGYGMDDEKGHNRNLNTIYII